MNSISRNQADIRCFKSMDQFVKLQLTSEYYSENPSEKEKILNFLQPVGSCSFSPYNTDVKSDVENNDVENTFSPFNFPSVNHFNIEKKIPVNGGVDESEIIENFIFKLNEPKAVGKLFHDRMNFIMQSENNELTYDKFKETLTEKSFLENNFTEKLQELENEKKRLLLNVDAEIESKKKEIYAQKEQECNKYNKIVDVIVCDIKQLTQELREFNEELSLIKDAYTNIYEKSSKNKVLKKIEKELHASIKNLLERSDNCIMYLNMYRGIPFLSELIGEDTFIEIEKLIYRNNQMANLDF
jgi:hypothetical protein